MVVVFLLGESSRMPASWFSKLTKSGVDKVSYEMMVRLVSNGVKGYLGGFSIERKNSL